jgi:hypothetical protein
MAAIEVDNAATATAAIRSWQLLALSARDNDDAFSLFANASAGHCCSADCDRCSASKTRKERSFELPVDHGTLHRLFVSGLNFDCASWGEIKYPTRIMIDWLGRYESLEHPVTGGNGGDAAGFGE